MSDKQTYILNQLRRQEVPVSIYLVNGFKLEGIITGFDRFVVLLQDEKGGKQKIYKHAISTIQPEKAVPLTREDDIS